MSILSTHQLSWSYDATSRHIFAGLDFVVHKGDFVVIHGASGSGKTTLMKLLTGSLSVAPGHVFFGRDDISRYTASELQLYKRQLGLVFQDNLLLDQKNVAENITYPLYLMGQDDSAIARAYDDVVHSLGIA